MFTDRVTDKVKDGLSPLLQDLEQQMAHQQDKGDLPDEESIIAELKRLEAETHGLSCRITSSEPTGDRGARATMSDRVSEQPVGGRATSDCGCSPRSL